MLLRKGGAKAKENKKDSNIANYKKTTTYIIYLQFNSNMAQTKKQKKWRK